MTRQIVRSAAPRAPAWMEWWEVGVLPADPARFAA
jgi:hypothetical protein